MALQHQEDLDGAAGVPAMIPWQPGMNPWLPNVIVILEDNDLEDNDDDSHGGSEVSTLSLTSRSTRSSDWDDDWEDDDCLPSDDSEPETLPQTLSLSDQPETLPQCLLYSFISSATSWWHHVMAGIGS